MWVLLKQCLLAFLTSFLVPVHGQNVTYADCDTSVYYAGLGTDPTNWTRDSIVALLTTSHRTVLLPAPNGTGTLDILTALVDLWPGFAGTVKLIYSDFELPATPSNTPETWTRVGFWPVSHGAVQSSPVYTDVHSTAPIKWTVLDSIGDSPFGYCGTVDSMTNCISPATNETSNSTTKDQLTFKPPDDQMGDVARSLFYTALRYAVDLNLTLTDCAPFGSLDFGYRSALLQMHQNDPVDVIEQVRNTEACRQWQGNRNIFVDYPNLVETFFGTPDVIATGTTTYSQCVTQPPTETPSLAPILSASVAPSIHMTTPLALTAVPTLAVSSMAPSIVSMAPSTVSMTPSTVSMTPSTLPDPCSQLSTGDVYIYAFNSIETDQVVLLPIVDVPPDVGTLYITNNPWNGSQLLEQDGTVKIYVPADGFQEGILIGYNIPAFESPVAVAANSSEESNFLLSTRGDHIFLYCEMSDGGIHFISGLNYAGNWSEPGLPSYAANESALPDELNTTGSVVLAGYPNWAFTGSTHENSSDALIAEFDNSSNYEGSDSPFVMTLLPERATLPPGAVSEAPSASAAPSLAPNECSSIPPGIIGFILINSDPPVQVILFPLTDIPANVSSLFMTNNAWDGTKLLNQEGTVEYTIAPQGIKAGNIFGYNTKLKTDFGNWSIVDDSIFSLKTLGDNLFVYCLSSHGDPHFISAVSYSGPWADPGLSSYQTDQSALPDELNETGNLVLKGYPDWRETSSSAGNFDQLLKLFWNASNYEGSTIPIKYATSGGRNARLSSLVALSVALLCLMPVLL